MSGEIAARFTRSTTAMNTSDADKLLTAVAGSTEPRPEPAGGLRQGVKKEDLAAHAHRERQDASGATHGVHASHTDGQEDDVSAGVRLQVRCCSALTCVSRTTHGHRLRA